MPAQEVIDHEAGGHGMETRYPAFSQLLMQARVLDRRSGTTRGTDWSYGNHDMHESWAVGVEEFTRNDARSRDLRPAFTRLVDAAFSDEGVSTKFGFDANAAIEAMVPSMMLALLGVGTRRQGS